MKKLQGNRLSLWHEDENKEDAFLLGIIRLTLTGDHQLLVENFKGISYFDEKLIVVQSGKHIAAISGQKLQVQYYTKDEMLVMGNIEKIELKECDF